MRPRMVLEAMVLPQPAEATAAIMLRGGQGLLIGIAPYGPHTDDVRSASADKDAYAWELRDPANCVLRKGRQAKTEAWRSEWHANGGPAPKVLEVPALGLQVVVPNVGGTLVIYDTKPGTISDSLDCNPRAKRPPRTVLRTWLASHTSGHCPRTLGGLGKRVVDRHGNG